jgi:hypothetical protein
MRLHAGSHAQEKAWLSFKFLAVNPAQWKTRLNRDNCRSLGCARDDMAREAAQVGVVMGWKANVVPGDKTKL